jgi:hypothetical protein
MAQQYISNTMIKFVDSCEGLEICMNEWSYDYARERSPEPLLYHLGIHTVASEIPKNDRKDSILRQSR